MATSANLFSSVQEKKVMRFFIIFFWWLFWLFNVIDRFVPGQAFVWLGRDRLLQYTKYFNALGIFDPAMSKRFFVFTSALELIALVLITGALWHFAFSSEKGAHFLFFLGSAFALFIFTFFIATDQIFGDRMEFFEHSLFWIAALISWFTYTQLEERKA